MGISDVIASAAPGLVTTVLELEVESPGAGRLQVLEFRGQEELSSPYAFDVTVVAHGADEVDAKELLSKHARLSVRHADDDARRIHGIVAQAAAWDTGGGPERFQCTLRLVPRLWSLGLGQRSRIYQGLSTPQIVEKVLDEHRVPWRAALSGRYGPREYCVQYRESDLAFVSRLLEEEGIFYFFEQANDGETVVLGDHGSAHPEVPGESALAFREPSGMATHEQHVHAFQFRREVQPTAVALTDYDFELPGLDLSSRSAVEGGALEVYEHPGRYTDPGIGRTLSRIRLEEIGTRVEVASGQSDAAQLAPGLVFHLIEHAVASFDDAYLVRAVRHQGWQPQVLTHSHQRADRPTYVNDFVCQRQTVPFRPERRTPRPVISGPQTAVVVGPPGEEIHTDHHGRIKVQFHWDREGQRDDRSSCWIRVAQAWAGPGWGALYLPRIGHEVVVEFLDGDPDRPLVTGSVYNGENPPPVDLPGDKTASTLRSSTSPADAGGANELRFQDARDAEQVYLHAQRDLVIRVENDKDQTVGGDESLVVQKDRSRQVEGRQSLSVAKDDTATVGGSQHLTVAGSRHTHVGGDHDEAVGGNQTVQVGGARAVTVGLAAAENVGLAKALTVGGAYAITVGGALNEAVGGLRSEEIGAAKVERVGGDRREQVVGSRTVDVGGELVEQVGKSRSLTVKQDLSVNVGGDLQHAVAGQYRIKGKEIVVIAEDQFTIQVGAATIQVKKGGDVVIKGAKVDVKASGAITLKGSTVSEN